MKKLMLELLHQVLEGLEKILDSHFFARMPLISGFMWYFNLCFILFFRLRSKFDAIILHGGWLIINTTVFIEDILFSGVDIGLV